MRSRIPCGPRGSSRGQGTPSPGRLDSCGPGRRSGFLAVGFGPPSPSGLSCGRRAPGDLPDRTRMPSWSRCPGAARPRSAPPWERRLGPSPCTQRGRPLAWVGPSSGPWTFSLSCCAPPSQPSCWRSLPSVSVFERGLRHFILRFASPWVVRSSESTSCAPWCETRSLLASPSGQKRATPASRPWAVFFGASGWMSSPNSGMSSVAPYPSLGHGPSGLPSFKILPGGCRTTPYVIRSRLGSPGWPRSRGLSETRRLIADFTLICATSAGGAPWVT